jgi:hypothetical protein
MPESTFFNTKEFEHHPVFKPHGSIQVQITGPLIKALAIGPFNKELIDVLIESHKGLWEHFKHFPRWGYLTLFSQSALTNTETLDAVIAYNLDLAREGKAPHFLAYVIDDEVEGASLMRPTYTKAYANLPFPFRCFETIAEAQAWVEEQLQEK